MVGHLIPRGYVCIAPFFCSRRSKEKKNKKINVLIFRRAFCESVFFLSFSILPRGWAQGARNQNVDEKPYIIFVLSDKLTAMVRQCTSHTYLR